MVAKKTQSYDGPKKPTELLVAREEAHSRLEERIQKGRDIRSTKITSHDQVETFKQEYDKWNSYNFEYLRRIFSTEEFAIEYNWAGATGARVVMHRPTPGEEISRLFTKIDGKTSTIESIIERLELIPLASSASVPSGVIAPDNNPQRTNKIFIVHGHDEIAKTSLEVFLRELGLEPVVLHRQADEGLTVIEKFEKHSDVGYAFIILTPDEIAYLKADEEKEDSDRKKERRARPNVIFEFGYFVGKLGRPKVCCLHTGDVTLPSDVNGMIYKKYSSSIEEVAFSIIKDLKASGYNVTLS